MANNSSSFTGRMLRRASNRINYYSAGTADSNDHLKRKYNILCAIDDKSGQQRNDGNSKAPTNPQSNVKTMKIETEGNNESVITSLPATIDDLNVDIAALGIQETPTLNTREVIKMCSRIYPILADIKFEPSPHLIDDNKDNENFRKLIPKNPEEIFQTPPKPPRRVGKPNLESTRKGSPKNVNKANSNQNSPQVECTISPITIENSPMTQEQLVGRPIIIKCPTGIENFLHNPVEPELLCKSTISNGNAQDVSNPRLNVSDSISEIPTPLYRKIKQLLIRYGRGARDECVVPQQQDNQALDRTFDRTTKFYRSLSQRIKRRLRTAMIRERVIQNPTDQFDYSLPKDESKREQAKDLLTKVQIQQTIINQTSKALELCQSLKEFMASTEEVESQRFLLVAELRRRVLLNKLKSLSYVDDKRVYNIENSTYRCAKVSIRNIRLTLKKCLYREPEPGEIQEWYLATIIEGTTVWASSAVPCPINSYTLDFPEFGCVMDNLTPNFKVVIEIYVLRLTTGIPYGHEIKYHLEEETKNITCPTPKKLLKRVERPTTPRTGPVVLSSSFKVTGYTEFYLRDLSLSSPWPLEEVPPDSILLGTIDLELNCNLHYSIEHQGFVTQGNECGGLIAWNRRWCILKSHTLLFWNYPEDQENKMPMMVINLMHCVSEQISPAHRSLCAKPRTLLIETLRVQHPDDTNNLMMECHQSFTIIKHLLSFDSTRELVDWMSKLNHILSILREWNFTSTLRVIHPPTSPPMVSEL
ncbi:anillin-like [Chelonus insularis]|uniref:anillin-like n=1 Tax=Chelonus insularis TaxID=460826 RepID=UPI00158D64BB|nr:anillin-like [Chelonus insularis]